MMVGGLLMVIAAGAIMVGTLMLEPEQAELLVKIVPWIFLVGALLFVTMQRMQTYEGTRLVVRRLRSIQLLSGICFIIAGLLMVENFYHFVMPLVVSDIGSYYTYLQVVHNNWVVLMLIGAILQMYTVHRIAAEMDKE